MSRSKWRIVLIALSVLVAYDAFIVITHKLPEVPKHTHWSPSYADQETEDKPSSPTTTMTKPGSHRVAGLDCAPHGGPSNEDAAEMVYWQDIPSDAEYASPLKRPGERKYLTFEPDEGGWNNIRMSMETAVTLAHAMGRTLVMPPSQGMYLIWESNGGSQKKRFDFGDFFHFDSVGAEHLGFEIITFQEFLEREVQGDKLVNKDGEVVKLPFGRTNLDGSTREEGKQIDQWLRTFTTNPIWAFDDCMVGIPKQPGPDGVIEFDRKLAPVAKITSSLEERVQKFINNPVPVNATPADRLEESYAHRSGMCLYDDALQNATFFHLMGDNASGARLLVHFYAFLFFEDWKSDLWTKRFVRDHLRYVDEIQCAAAQVVTALRQRAREYGDPSGTFFTMHVRRGDFQYHDTRISAEEIFSSMNDVIPVNTTVFIATDEKDKQFFDVFRKNYNVFFLNDFRDLIQGINTNFYGMLDQRIASRGHIFVGCFYSTFTGYINRMRGYHSQKEKANGWELGLISSYYYIPTGTKTLLRRYEPIAPPMWAREFPIGWRDLDRGIEELYREYVKGETAAERR